MADSNYISRDWVSISATTNRQEMGNTFTNMLYSVSNMIAKEPVYTTWIIFQIGNKKPLIFNTATTNPKQNLIASLNFKKKGSGTANNFEITIQYDPFRMGQNPTDEIELLDEYIAKAMSMEWNEDVEILKGYIQYGYNCSSDAKLVSPKYEFYLTNASSEVQFDSGLTTYTFEGVSTISADCDNNTTFGECKDWDNILQVVEWTLFYWYGDNAHRPKHLESGECRDNEYKYRIDIPDEIYQNASGPVTIPADSGKTPWEYCQSLLEQYPLTKAEEQQEVYQDLSKLPYNRRPRYEMSITDVNGVKTIHIAHIKPAAPTIEDEKTGKVIHQKAEASDVQIDYQFTWGKQQRNIVLGWKPNVDLKLYLIRRARYLRYKDELANANGDEKAILNIKENMTSVENEINEMYDAQLQILGIPCDVPIGAEVTIVPRVLESVSRTAGIYSVKGCEDSINNRGQFVTTLELLRVRGLEEQTEEYKYREPEPETLVDATQAANDYSGGGGGFSAGRWWRRLLWWWSWTVVELDK